MWLIYYLLMSVVVGMMFAGFLGMMRGVTLMTVRQVSPMTGFSWSLLHDDPRRCGDASRRVPDVRQPVCDGLRFFATWEWTLSPRAR